jgi:hypothetical protein
MTDVVDPKLRREKDFLLEALEIYVPRLDKTWDFSSHMWTLTYEENILTPAIHGSLTVKDSVGYDALIPLVGEERIQFKFTRQDEDSKNLDEKLPSITFEGHIYEITDKEIQNGSKKFQIYTLKFYSDEMMLNFKQRISQAWNGKTNSEIVQDIFESYLTPNPRSFAPNLDNPIQVSETLNVQNYVASNRKPLGIVSDLMYRSKCANGGGCLYRYFQTRDGYKFTTIGELIAQEPIKTLYSEIRNTSGAESVKDIARNINTIYAYNERHNFNSIDSLDEGKMNSRLIGIDPIRRKINVKDFDLREEWDSIPHTDTQRPFSDNEEHNTEIGDPTSRMQVIISDQDHDITEHLIAKDPDIRCDKLEEIIQVRESQKRQVLQNMLVIRTPGDPRFKAGDTINIIIPEALGKQSEKNIEEENKLISGKYLIFGVMHILQHNQYNCAIEIMRDSHAVYFEDTHRDPIKEYEKIY